MRSTRRHRNVHAGRLAGKGQATSLVVLAVGAALLTGGLVRLSVDRTDPELAFQLAPRPGATGFAYSFEDLFTEPDLIVEGRVLSTGLGRVVGEPESELQLEQTELEVTSVYAGDYVARTLLIETESEGLEFGQEWREPGMRVLAFLWLKRDAASAGRFYRLISPEAVAIVAGDSLIPATMTATSSPLEGMTLQELAASVRRSHAP
jgi:hypothetical protein